MSDNPSLNNSYHSENNQTVILEIAQRLTVIEAVSFKELCHSIFEQNDPPETVILDFQNTNFIDSSGVGSLVHSQKLANQKQIDLVFSNVTPPVMSVLTMTGLNKVFTIESTVETVYNKREKKTKTSALPTHPSLKSPLKRGMDIIGGLIGLLITGILFLPIAIAIKIDTPGPILFQQTRCSWLGKRFKIWKFRSMRANAEQLKSQVENQAKGAIFKNENDPRITKVGRFLRKTSLDEFPQFWNVLKGEMSLVGTRPPTPDEVDNYEIPAWQRLNVKPGLTGEWQVNGRSDILDFEDIVKLDLRYQENWSLMYDIKLILKTITILFTKKSGAV